MKKLKLLVAEGNVPEENEYFKSKGIRTHTESLKESILNYYSDFDSKSKSVKKSLKQTKKTL